MEQEITKRVRPQSEGTACNELERVACSGTPGTVLPAVVQPCSVGTRCCIGQADETLEGSDVKRSPRSPQSFSDRQVYHVQNYSEANWREIFASECTQRYFTKFAQLVLWFCCINTS